MRTLRQRLGVLLELRKYDEIPCCASPLQKFLLSLLWAPMANNGRIVPLSNFIS